MNRNLLAFAMSLALLLSAAAHAQTTQLKITVPFDFIAGDTVLPAGDYNVQSMGPWGGPTLSVHNVNSNAGTIVIEGRSRADRVREVMMLAQFHFKPEALRESLRGSFAVAPPQNMQIGKRFPYPHPFDRD